MGLWGMGKLEKGDRLNNVDKQIKLVVISKVAKTERDKSHEMILSVAKL